MKFDAIFFKKQLPILLAVIGLVMAIRSSIIEPFRIPTRSMLPGLMTGDFLFVNKVEYGFHFPFSESWGIKPLYIGEKKQPQRGDVVIFTPPEAGQENMYIKRIIGLPGDIIRIEKKAVYLNGVPISKTEVLNGERTSILKHKGFDPEERYENSKLHLYNELLPSGRNYLTIEDSTFEAREAIELTVKDDNYFVLGDNRDDTKDSRTFGVIPFNSIRGRAFVIWMSYRVSMNDSNWSFRPERIGKMIY